MAKSAITGALAAVLLAGVLAGPPSLAALDCSDAATVGRVALDTGSGTAVPGSRANPWINRHHVYCGDINRRGKAVGYHYREDGQDPRAGPGDNNPAAARITGAVKPQAGAEGWRVYRGEGIEIWDDRSERYVRKRGFSTFFPDRCSPAEVLASIRHAMTQSKRPIPAKGGRFRGLSGPADGREGYCYRQDQAGGPKLPFPVSGFLNDLREGGWTINTAYPDQ